jgi:hypothetical protein
MSLMQGFSPGVDLIRFSTPSKVCRVLDFLVGKSTSPVVMLHQGHKHEFRVCIIVTLYALTSHLRNRLHNIVRCEGRKGLAENHHD